MKKSLLSTILLLFSFLLTVAAPVDEQSARKIASYFLSSRMHGLTRASSSELTRAITGVADGVDAGIYLFNAGNGFVVISADDELPAVLAYGLGHSYDAQVAPPAMKALLEAYHYAAKSSAKTRAAVAIHSDISPLLKTTWNQETPYNNNCPTDTDSGEKCPTGCVATALAQIMYYHKWPATFDWDSMKTGYDEDYTGKAAGAVADLMADVGKKVFMDYEIGGSSAADYDACEALRISYDFSENTELISRSCYTASSWDETLYNELAAQRPCYYSGCSVSSGQGISGHAFVIDGYQTKDGVGYFHVNWGWGGYSDDYFLISILNPEKEYTGGNAGSSGYSFGQFAIIGAEKGNTGDEKSTRLFTANVSIVGNKSAFTRTSTSVDFPAIQLRHSMYNVTNPAEARYYELAYALYQDRKLVEIIDSVSLKDITPGGAALDYLRGASSYITGELNFGKGLADGTYQLRLLTREAGKKNWHWAMGAVCRYVEIKIDGTNMTTTTYGGSQEEDVYSFKINSVKVSDDCEVGKPITITINLTDKNATNNSAIFLYGNASLEQGADKFQLLTGGGTNLAAGETGDVVLVYTPQRAGEFVFYLSGNVDELTDSLYRFEATVSGFAMTMEMDVDGAKATSSGVNELAGTTFKGTLHFTNYGSAPYNNMVYLDFFGGTAPNTMRPVEQLNETLNLGIGETKDIPFSFDNLTVGNYYMLLVTALDGKEEKALNYEFADEGYIRYYYNIIYLATTDTAIRDIKVDADDADVYDMRGVRLGKVADLKNLPKGIYVINKKKVIR